MPSQFEMAMAAQLPATHYATFGLPAVYTPPDGSASSNVTVRVQRGPVRQVERANRATGEAQTAKVMVMLADLDRPVIKGRFVVEGVEVWTVETTPILKNGEFVCDCTRQGVDSLVSARAKNA